MIRRLLDARLWKALAYQSMGLSVPPPPLIRFGVFELHLRSGELFKHGHKIRLEGQPVQILVCLLENPGQLVTREELHARLWRADTFVNFEHGLNAAVKRLRQALNDAADKPRFVETLPRRGYRFIAPVETVAVTTADEPAAPAAPAVPPAPIEIPPVSSETKSRPRLWIWLGAGLLAATGILALWKYMLDRHPQPVIHSLAVLPLENLSGDATQDYFSDGMTDALITELGQISQIRVISRTSVMTYKGAHKPLPEIARDLNVDAVVEGAVLRSGNQVRITAQLIQAADDKHLWAKSYEGEMGDMLGLQKQVARSISQEIRVELTPREQEILRHGKRVNPEAYEAYLRGRFFWNKRTADGLRKAIEYFNLAIQKDPECTQAYAGLADSYALLGDWEYGVLAPKEAYQKAEAAANKALEIDNALGEAHISLAFCLDGFDWDWERAGKEFQRGIALSPGYATGHQWYAWHLAALGRNDEAIAELKKAESLDPLSLIISADLAEALRIAHRSEDAIRQSRKAMDMDPFFALAHYELGQAFVEQHRFSEAIAELEKALELSAGSTTYKANLAYAFAVSGDRKSAVKILDDLKRQSQQRAFANAPEIALVYVGLTDHDQAMAWLEKAYEERFNPGVLLRPEFDLLRGDSRFQNLLHRIGLGQ